MRLRRLSLVASFTAFTGACLPEYSTTAGSASETGTDTTGAPTTGEPTTGEPTTTTTNPTTTAPASCGDGQLDGGEVCDGAALGGKTCGDIDPSFTGGALACAADCLAFDTSGCTGAPAQPAVVLNELTAKAVAEGPYADKGDAIELYNAGVRPADLSGWRLADDPALPVDATYVFPPGSTLAPGAYLVLVGADLPFELEGEASETLALADARGAALDTVTFVVADAATSWCRLPDGAGAWQTCAQTFGAANAAQSAVCGDGIRQRGEACDGLDLGGQTCEDLGRDAGTLACTPTCAFDTSQCGAPQPLAVVVNEIESVDDKIELYNAGDAPVDLAGWILTDDVVDADYDPMADAEKLVFPAMTLLGAKQFLVIPKGMGPLEHPFGLGADGDSVTLARPDLDIVDQVAYGVNEAATSYCRLPDGPGGAWTVGCVPTFGAANQGP